MGTRGRVIAAVAAVALVAAAYVAVHVLRAANATSADIAAEHTRETADRIQTRLNAAVPHDLSDVSAVAVQKVGSDGRVVSVDGAHGSLDLVVGITGTGAQQLMGGQAETATVEVCYRYLRPKGSFEVSVQALDACPA